VDLETPFMSFMKPIYENCSMDIKNKLISTLGDVENPFMKGLQLYFDSKIVHELTHPLIEAQGIVFGQRWVTEFFCDYTNYAFLQKHKEYSEMLEIQKIIPHLIYEGAMPFAEYQRLEDFDNFWVQTSEGMTLRGSPLNLLWFYMKGMRGVIELYDLYGEDFITSVLEAYSPSNKQFISRIKSTNSELAQWFNYWITKNR
jgi:hypothetical protein